MSQISSFEVAATVFAVNFPFELCHKQVPTSGEPWVVQEMVHKGL